MKKIVLIFIWVFSLLSFEKVMSQAPNVLEYDSIPGVVIAQKVVNVVIKINDEQQNIYGFGASDAWRCQFVGKNWPLEKKEKIADLLFSKAVDKQGNPKGIGLSIWRFYIGAGSAEQGADSNIKDSWRRAECFQNADGTYNWNKQAGQQWFLQAAKKRGVEKFLAFTIAPPVQMALNGRAYNESGTNNLNIQPGKMQAYAQFLTDVMAHFEKEKGISFDYLSPINEPQWEWNVPKQEGSQATNTDMYQLTSLLSRQLMASKVSTKILLGEAGDIQYLYKKMNEKESDRQIQLFYGHNSVLNLNKFPNVQHAITGHSYFTTWPVKNMINYRKALHDTIQKIDPTLQYWETEFCILEKNDDIGNGKNRDLGMNTALYYARVIYHDLVIANANSWQFWTALSESDFKDGLIYLDNVTNGAADPTSLLTQKDGVFQDSKTLWALGNYSAFVKPGMKRIGLTYTNHLTEEEIAKNLMVSAFINKQKNELVLVAVNYSNENQLLKIVGEDFKIKGNQFKMYTTSAKKNLERSSCINNHIMIGARSVVTLVGKIK